MLIDFLCREDGTKEMIDSCLRIVTQSKGLIIFGAGVGGRQLLDLLQRKNCSEKILCFSDNNALKYNSKMTDEVIVVEPEKLFNNYGDSVTVIIASSAYREIKKQLLDYGFRENNIYLFNFAFMDLEYTDCEFIFDHISDFERAYCKMSDEKSRIIFQDILNYKITKKNTYLEHMQNYVDDENKQYFDDGLFDFYSDEIFLDIGAYTGDTFDSFCSAYNVWGHYIGIEADPEMYRILDRKVLTNNNNDNVELYNVAAWDKKDQLFFDVNPGSSSVSSGGLIGKKEVDAVSIDELLNERSITFIKMDIEGAEYNALIGMKNVLKKNKPILAVCVYHLRDDYYRITDTIEDFCPNEYRFYFRQYRFTPTETVCFAIPQHRALKEDQKP